MRRGCAAALVLVPMLCAGLMAHAGLRFSSPFEGATLGDTPDAVQLTFGERPDPAVSTIQVVDTAGVRHDVGSPALVPGDPLAVSVRLRPLATGVYTVHWRVVSAVDGHATSGSYAFGVRASPAPTGARPAAPPIARREVAVRWVLLVGLIVLLGAASADIAGFGGPLNLALAFAGVLLSAAGVVLLALAQSGTAGVPLGALLGTFIGRALVWRTLALAAAAVGLVAAAASGRSRRLARTAGMSVAATAVLIAMAVHAAAGHAGAGRENVLGTVASQWAHFAATGIWIGGLAALLLGFRRTTPEARTIAAKRFSKIAGAALVIVLVTGILRAFDELTAWSELTGTAYGRTLLLKSALFGIIAVFGAINRWRGLPRVGASPRLLRTVGSAELACAALVLGAAALLGALPPPAAQQVVPGISASGVDFATTVRVTLTAASDQPGPNRFIARIVDYDSRSPINADRVSLRFTPLDDPGLPATSLALARSEDGTYAGSGANLSLDGRWRISVGVERGGSSVDAPVDIEVRGRSYPVQVTRIPNQPVAYTVEVRGLATLQFSADPGVAGPNRLAVTCYDFIGDQRQVATMTVTLATGGAAAQEVPLKRVSAGRFAADVNLSAGRHTVSAVARATDGTRVRATVQIDVPGR